MCLCADLHIHTSESDGALTPSQVVKAAHAAGLSTIAITDHDCVNGVTEALMAARLIELEVIPGIEFSCLFNNQEVHVLGYYIDVSNRDLRQEANYIARARRDRAEKIVKKLNKLGVDISFERVTDIAGGEIIGRPHIAKAMIEKGYIQYLQQAFTKAYIDKDGKAYVERYKLTPDQAIELIHSAGGVAVIAHPGLCYRGVGLEEKDIKTILGYGLDGIEVFHSSHSDQQKVYYEAITSKYDLLVTGGSDFHGGCKKEGAEIGSICLPHKYIKELKKRVMLYKF